MKNILKMKPEIPLEADIEKYLVRRCMMKGWLCWKLVSPGRRGVPDRAIYASEGVHILVEVKRPKGGKVSPLQSRTIHKLMEKGHRAEIVKDMEQVDKLIEYLQRRVDANRVIREEIEADVIQS